MEINKIRIIVKILIRLNRVILFIFIVFSFTNCHQKEVYKNIALLENYKIHQNGRYNLNLYLLENYNRNKSLKENLEVQDSIKCFVIIIDKKQNDSIEYLKKKINKEYILCNIFVELLNKEEHTFRKERNIIEIENTIVKCDFYMIFDNFRSFKIYNFFNVGTDSIHLVE